MKRYARWMRPRFVLLLALVPLAAAKAESPQKANPESLQRWREARLGMFIHWGPVSLKETEISWSRANSNPQCPNNGPIPVAVYDNLYKEFNPTKFNAREWVAIAQAAGMKYMVLTAKHCDGFLLWDSKVESPGQRDCTAGPARRLAVISDRQESHSLERLSGKCPIQCGQSFRWQRRDSLGHRFRH